MAKVTDKTTQEITVKVRLQIVGIKWPENTKIPTGIIPNLEPMSGERCPSVSAEGFPCDHPEGHSAEHRNAWAGPVWGGDEEMEEQCDRTRGGVQCTLEKGHNHTHIKSDPFLEWAHSECDPTERCHSKHDGKRCDQPVDHEGPHTYSVGFQEYKWAKGDNEITKPLGPEMRCPAVGSNGIWCGRGIGHEGEHQRGYLDLPSCRDVCTATHGESTDRCDLLEDHTQPHHNSEAKLIWSRFPEEPVEQCDSFSPFRQSNRCELTRDHGGRHLNTSHDDHFWDDPSECEPVAVEQCEATSRNGVRCEFEKDHAMNHLHRPTGMEWLNSESATGPCSTDLLPDAPASPWQTDMGKERYPSLDGIGEGGYVAHECKFVKGHTQSHQSTNGHTWTDPKRPASRCASYHPNFHHIQCTKDKDHPRHHGNQHTEHLWWDRKKLPEEVTHNIDIAEDEIATLGKVVIPDDMDDEEFEKVKAQIHAEYGGLRGLNHNPVIVSGEIYSQRCGATRSDSTNPRDIADRCDRAANHGGAHADSLTHITWESQSGMDHEHKTGTEEGNTTGPGSAD